MPSAAAGLHVGTSGWSYPEWRGGFYPERIRSGDFLTHYAERFDTTEINGTFYRLPRPASVQRWREAVPAGFLFAVKAHRFITHMKRLQDPAEGLGNFLPLIEPLGAHLGPILFQLPTRWPRDKARLAALLAALPDRHRYSIEFRHDSWFEPPVLALLERYGVAFCQSDIAGPPPEFVTAGFVFLRLHGPDPKKPYYGSYGEQRLAEWAARIANWRARGIEVFCYFDNTASGDAPRDALRLLEVIRRG